MIGNPTRLHDIAIVIGDPMRSAVGCSCDDVVGMFVRVTGIDGADRTVDLPRPVRIDTGDAVIHAFYSISGFPDALLQPFRPPAPDESIDGLEDIGVLV